MTTVSVPSALPPRPAAKKRAAPPAWFGGDMPFARWGLIFNLLLPIGLLIWDAYHDRLGADATTFAIHTTGLIAVVYLILTLLVTPLRQVTGFGWLVQFRRSLGVYAFYYAVAHLSIYFWWQQGHDVKSTVYEITHRWYLIVGFTSLALMAPLWATSFNAAIRWMGGDKWKWLHRLTYVAVLLAGYHYYLQSKSYKRNAEIYLAVAGGLLVWRVVAAFVKVVRKPAAKPVARTAGATKNASKAAAPAAGGKARNWRGDLKVVGMFKETPSVRTFRLAPPDSGPVPFAFAAGQFLNLTIVIDGKKAGRSYTIASPPTRDGYVELTVKREDHGHVSGYLHDLLMTGQTVGVQAPSGRFTFDPKGEDAVLLVAGGVGVTPVMAILRDLTDRCWPGKIDLVFSVKTPADRIFSAELDYLTARHPNLHVHTTYTQHAPPGWSGPRGHVTAEMLRELVPDFAARHAFVCGPDAMANAVHDELRSAGVIEGRVTRESFTPAAAPANPTEPAAVTHDQPDAPAEGTDAADTVPAESAPNSANGTATVTFEQSGQSGTLKPKQTVLEAAEALGVSIPFQCRQGTCGTCKCRLLEGEVTMRTRDALSGEDEADGYILACQARATGDVTIEA